MGTFLINDINYHYEKRSYKITFALKEGYSKSGRLHTAKFAGKIIGDWMTNRLAAGQPVVPGFLHEGTLFFPAVGDNKETMVTASPSAIFSGELSSPEDMLRKDKEVKQTLESLSMALKKRLKQQSVFIIYRDENWCVN